MNKLHNPEERKDEGKSRNVKCRKAGRKAQQTSVAATHKKYPVVAEIILGDPSRSYGLTS